MARGRPATSASRPVGLLERFAPWARRARLGYFRRGGPDGHRSLRRRVGKHHALHPFLVAALYHNREWRFAIGNYAYLLAAPTALVARGRPLALCRSDVWLNTGVWKSAPVLEWFVPAFFLKLLASHAAGETQEEDWFLPA